MRRISSGRQATLFLLLFPLLLCGQTNLIANGGFENGLSGWAPFWSRTANAGSVNVVNDVFYAGDHSALVVHHDPQDWSFAVDRRYSVKPGEIYEFSARLRVDRVGWAEMSVIIYDKSQRVIEWSYGGRSLEKCAQFLLFSTQFIIPEGVAFINPRFIGGGDCKLYIDEAALVLKGRIGGEKNHALENPAIKLQVTSPFLTLQVTDRRNGVGYTSASSTEIIAVGVDSTADQLIFSCRNVQNDLPMTLRLTLLDDALKIELEADAEAPLGGPLRFPAPFFVRKKDFLTVPRGPGYLQPVTEKYPFWEFDMGDWKATMAFVGVTDLRTGYMLVSDNPWDTVIDFPLLGTYTTPRLNHLPIKDRFGEKRVVYFVPVKEKGYVEMCRWYRRHAEALGYVKPWPQKIHENPAVERLRGAVDFWLLDERLQTVAFIDTLLNYGVDRAVLSLSGSWYAPEDKSELIDYINDSGFLSSRYDIYTDVWPPDHPEVPWYRTEGFPDDVIVNKDGSLRTGWLAYLEGNTPFQGYYTCSQTHERYAEKWIAEELLTQRYNCRFIDVELASELCECYSPLHPLTRRQDAYYRTRLLEKVKSGFGLVTGSEEARDWAFTTVDYGEGTMTLRPQNNAGYDWANPINDPEPEYFRYNINPAVRVPLHGLVYHDVHVPTWYTGDGQSKVPRYWDDKDLWNILYASMPLFAPPNRTFWQNNKERYLTSYFLICSVFREFGFLPMLDHTFLDEKREIQQTDYAGGQVIVNFSEQPVAVEGKTLAPKGFYAAGEKAEIYKLMIEGRPAAVARLEDRLFINPYGSMLEIHGIRTSGPVLLMKKERGLHLAFIGSQTFVELDPSRLPWPMEGIRAYSLDGTELKLEAVGTRLKLNKKPRMQFYRIEGLFTSVGKAEEPRSPALDVLVFPNPCNTRCRIVVQAQGPFSAELYNLLGEKVPALEEETAARPAHVFTLRGEELAAGIYFFRCHAGGQQLLRKIVLFK